MNIEPYRIMLVQSYAPPIPTSITAKSTLTKNSYLDSEEVAFRAAWCRQQLAYLLLKKHVEGQDGEETEVCRHCSSVGVLQKRESKVLHVRTENLHLMQR